MRETELSHHRHGRNFRYERSPGPGPYHHYARSPGPDQYSRGYNYPPHSADRYRHDRSPAGPTDRYRYERLTPEASPSRSRSRHSPGRSASSSKVDLTLLSSDGPDGASNPFPTIEAFVERLKESHRKKTFDGIIKYCDEREYEYVNELAHMSAKELEERMKLSEAAARLVHEKIARCVTKIKADMRSGQHH
jgi:hypothetical protein